MTACAAPQDSCRCFGETDVWIFDLDNTLYPAESNLFVQVAERMNTYIEELLDIDADAARQIRRQYYLDYGTTLAGLMDRHGVCPDTFLDYVHDIDHSPLEHNEPLAAAISVLPGRRFIFTNGSRRHAEQVAAKVGVLHLFEDIYDIKSAEYVPKPHRTAFDIFLKSHGVAPAGSAMFEDLPHNLETAHDLGMVTVLVTSPVGVHPSQREIGAWQRLPAHIHHVTEDLAGFLTGITPIAAAD
ncbi:MAG: pyrimidine 5'-nucleotidase [Hyphomicrobiaceae bacterium]